MKITLLMLLLAAGLCAQPLPVVAMQFNPDQIALSLRTLKPPMPAADCTALHLLECRQDFGAPQGVDEIALRWVQLDDDPQLEAILVTRLGLDGGVAAFVFDRQGTWNLVGSFSSSESRCDINNLIRVQRLAEGTPKMLLVFRDLGGTGVIILETAVFQLSGGKLWPALEVLNYKSVPWVDPYTEHQILFNVSNRVIVQTLLRAPPSSPARSTCEVLRWNAAKHAFVAARNENRKYCDPATGQPKPDQLIYSGLPLHL